MLIDKEEIIDIYRQYMTIDEEQLDVDLTLLGMDSLNFIKLIVDIEDRYNIVFPDEKLTMVEMNTFNKLYNVFVSISSTDSK